MLGAGAALLVRLYQLTLGKLLLPRCRFEPSCSSYAIGALRAHGLVKGLGLAVWRVVRCAPWTAGGLDPVPQAHAGPVRRAVARVRHG